MNILIFEEFKKLPDGEIFASGVLPCSPEGLYMCDTLGELRWIAKKGQVQDWTIYCHWSVNSEEWIRYHGDKVTQEKHIKLCVPCDDELYKHYRF